MVNLVGEDGTGHHGRAGLDEVLQVPGTFLHLYGKKKHVPAEKWVTSPFSPPDAALDHAIPVTKKHCRVQPMTRITA